MTETNEPSRSCGKETGDLNKRGGTETENGSSGSRELLKIPVNLPQAALTFDALAKRGLSELAKTGLRIEGLPSLPGPTHGHCLLADDARERVLLVGGWDNENGELWAFDFDRWTWECLQTGRFRPDAIGHPSVVLDTHRSRIVWFGGWPAGDEKSPVDDLYVLDLNGAAPLEWQYVEHTHPWPASRNGASLIFDARRDRCVLFGGDGGWSSCFLPRNDLWTLDLRTLTWERHKPGLLMKGPTKRWLHAAAVDPVRDRMVLLEGAGYKRTGPWSLALDTLRWHPLELSGTALPKMEGHAMVHDPNSDSMMIYGGLLLEGDGPSSMPYIWRLDLAPGETRRLDQPVDNLPAGRFCHDACFCKHRRALFVAGGKSNRAVGNYYKTEREHADAFLVYLD